MVHEEDTLKAFEEDTLTLPAVGQAHISESATTASKRAGEGARSALSTLVRVLVVAPAKLAVVHILAPGSTGSVVDTKTAECVLETDEEVISEAEVEAVKHTGLCQAGISMTTRLKEEV